MNRLMIISIATLMLASCSNDGLKDGRQGKVIEFRTTLTKANETTINNFNSFVATAINAEGQHHFANELFERLGTYYSSGTDYYWPVDGSSIDFYAWGIF